MLEFETILSFIQNNSQLSWITASALIFLAFLVFIIKTITVKTVVTTEELSRMPEAKVLEIQQVAKETRYVEKKVAKNNHDLNRYGRWKLIRHDGSEATRMGILSKVLTPEFKTYREIK